MNANRKPLLLALSVAALLLGPSAHAKPKKLQGCMFGDIPLHGKVKVVDSFPDIKIKIVESFPHLKVKKVDSFPDDCGEWKFVESFPDFKIQFVESWPDIKIKYVDSWPGRPR